MVVLGNVRLSVRIESWFKSDFFFPFFFLLKQENGFVRVTAWFC